LRERLIGNLICPAFSGLLFDVVGSSFNEFLPIQENQGFFGQEVDQAGGKSVKIRDLQFSRLVRQLSFNWGV